MKVPSPCFLIDEAKLAENLAILGEVQQEANVCILFALKAYALWKSFPLIRRTLVGACAGSLFEVRLAREKLGGEVHTYSPAFRDEEFPHILRDSDYVIFNSLSQLQHFLPAVTNSRVSVGIRVNPEVRTPGVKYEAYNPCTCHSRLGVTREQLEGNALDGVTGFHVHALCEQGADAFEALLEAFEASFGQYLPKLTWVNFGGGHLITDESYDRARFVRCLQGFQDRNPNILRIYIEPGEAVVLNAGYLVARVLDIIRNELDIAILDISVEAHIPDVLLTRHEPVPYVPKILGAGPSGKFEFTYILGGSSCAAGDVIGEYSFSRRLQVGDRLIFTDMAQYSMVKTSMFCGVGHPAIAIFSGDGSLSLLRSFTYSDYLARLC
jgi:carboxynorspermidine decarboxylase